MFVCMPVCTCLGHSSLPPPPPPVITSLLVSGESQDEVSLAGRGRTAALASLLHLHPPSAPHLQSLSLLHHKHPTLALSIALSAEGGPLEGGGESQDEGGFPKYSGPTTSKGPGGLRVKGGTSEESLALPPATPPTGVVMLLHNIIISGDDQTKAWFTQYMKLMQQKVRMCTCTCTYVHVCINACVQFMHCIFPVLYMHVSSGAWTYICTCMCNQCGCPRP